MSELSAGVRALLGRMESNPEEFYGEATKWAFMFEPNFRDVMTEPEKGALHEALKDVRRKEFDELVIRRMLQDEANEKMGQMRGSGVGMSRRELLNTLNPGINKVFFPQSQEADMQRNLLTGTGTTTRGQGLLQSLNPAHNSYNPNK